MKEQKARRRSLLRRMLSARGRSLEITRAGWIFIVLTLAVGFAAINSGSNLMHAIFGAQMALIVGSGMLSESTVRRTSARRMAVGTPHAGTPALMRVELRNLDPRLELLSVSVEDDDRAETAGTCAPVFAVRIPPGRTVDLSSMVTMPTRGRHRLPPAVVATRFPFGLFVKRRELGDPGEVLVYPRIIAGTHLRSVDMQIGQGEAAGRADRVGEFFGLREYRDGDDPRRIHWPAHARLDRPVVREHEARGDRIVILHLGPGRSGDPAFEREVERIASEAVAMLRIPGAAVGLRYGGDTVVEPGSGASHRQRLLEFLALAGGPA